MHATSVGIVGASGYSGIELCRLLAAHPGVSLRFATSDRWAGETVRQHTGIGGAVGALAYASPDRVEELAAGCEVVLLATPAEASLALTPELLKRAKRVIDLSGAFRLADASLYPTYYGVTHPAPSLLKDAVYALPELCGRERVQAARLVSNPGCYATAAALSVAPLLAAQVLISDSVVINAASGVTGAGRKAAEDYSFTEVMDDFRAYKVLRHQHSPEIDQTLTRVAGEPIRVAFSPHLLPIKRGILCTTFARTRPGVTSAKVASVLADAYGKEPFLTLLDSPDRVHLKAVVGTNRCLLAFAHEANRLVVVTAIDNLLKGAAGAAVQALNLMLGLEETTGLLSLTPHHP